MVVSHHIRNVYGTNINYANQISSSMMSGRFKIYKKKKKKLKETSRAKEELNADDEKKIHYERAGMFINVFF